MTFVRGFRFLPAPVVILVLVLGLAGRGSAQQLDVPFVPTPHEIVATMLKLAEVKPDDIHYDLGSGDGRIVIAAVRDFGVKKAVGVDLDPQRVAEANANAKAAGVTDRATFVQGNVFDFDFSGATVVTMYLLESVNQKLRPKVLDMKPGTRIVSHQFTMGDWEPDVHVSSDYVDIYHWVVPAKVGGGWRWGNYRLDLQQQFQKVSGTLTSGDTRVRIERASLTGDRLRFDARIGGKELSFDGRVAGDTIEAAIGNEKVTVKRAM